MQLKENARLQSGKYRIIRVLGQGGFGITYLAENTILGKQIAIKEFFPKDFCGRDNTSHLTLGTQNNADTVSKLKNRFLKEAQNISKLNHPGIVHIYDVFEENNTAYYVMDFIEGENLNEMVKRNGPLSEEKAIKYIKKVGDALEYIHSRNMTHFDVKPANIVVRKNDDQPILIDFGLSKQYDAHGDATSTLMQGVSQGYSPLELYNYGSMASFSPQTDVYSLGATLFFLLSGKVPPVPTDIMENGIIFPDSIPTDLRESITKALQSNRRNRPSSVDAFILSLNTTSIDNHKEETIYLEDEKTHQEIQLENDTFDEFAINEGETKTQKIKNYIFGINNLVLRKYIPLKRKIWFPIIISFFGILFVPFSLYFFRRSDDLIFHPKRYLQKLLFSSYLYPSDWAYEVSKTKAIISLSLISIISIIPIFLIILSNYKSQEETIHSFYDLMSQDCPIYIDGYEIKSINLKNNDIIFNCDGGDVIFHERDEYYNQYSNLIKDYIVNKGDTIYKKLKKTNFIINFYENNKLVYSQKIPFNKIKEYGEREKNITGKEFLSHYRFIENSRLPVEYGNGIVLKEVVLPEFAGSNNYLTYCFKDSTNLLREKYGSNLTNIIWQEINPLIPYFYPNVANGCDGIKFEIYDKKDSIIYEKIIINSQDIINNTPYYISHMDSISNLEYPSMY